VTRAEDFLWNIKAQEQQAREDHDRAIATLQSAWEATRELTALSGNSNFQAFVKKLQNLQDEAMRRLRNCRGPDHEMRQLMGWCQGVQHVLDLCIDTRARAEDLARKLKAAQDARERVVRPDGSVVPQGIL